MPVSPIDRSGPSSSTAATHFEPYQSVSFQQMRSRVHSLSSPPSRSPVSATEELPSASSASFPSSNPATGFRSRREMSLSPSPPASESSFRDTASPGSQTPLSQASDSSASSCSNVDPFLRQATASPTFASRKLTMRNRPGLATKRLLSEGDIISPRLTKRSLVANDPATRKRSSGNASISSAAAQSLTAAVGFSVASWREARKQRRNHQLAQRNKAPNNTKPRPSHPASQAKLTDPTKLDVLPELRLLSATRTAPIGWTQVSGAASFMPHMVEVYDERDAKRAPERQRFWPIIDHQLDYTGARMLSLSNACADLEAKPLLDGPVSPTSGLPLRHPSTLYSLQQPALPAYTQPIGSSDEDRSPVTPDAPAHRPTRPSRQAREAVAKEPHRKASIPLPPSATLCAVIDFTRAQASQRQHPRNAYGQLIHSPPSPPAETKRKRDLAPHAPLRIAPRAGRRSRDYFGHWEAYLCNFGKESTF